MIHRNLSEVCDRRVNRGKCGSERVEEMPTRKGSSRVPADGWQYGASKRGGSSRVPAREGNVAVRCQLSGQYGASGGNREEERGRIASVLATAD